MSVIVKVAHLFVSLNGLNDQKQNSKHRMSAKVFVVVSNYGEHLNFLKFLMVIEEWNPAVRAWGWI